MVTPLLLILRSCRSDRNLSRHIPEPAQQEVRAPLKRVIHKLVSPALHATSSLSSLWAFRWAVCVCSLPFFHGHSAHSGSASSATKGRCTSSNLPHSYHPFPSQVPVHAHIPESVNSVIKPIHRHIQGFTGSILFPFVIFELPYQV